MVYLGFFDYLAVKAFLYRLRPAGEDSHLHAVPAGNL
jgi:hypothetical protein